MARRWSNLKHGMSSKWFQALWEPQRCMLVDKPTGKHTVSAVSVREACSLSASITSCSSSYYDFEVPLGCTQGCHQSNT